MAISALITATVTAQFPIFSEISRDFGEIQREASVTSAKGGDDGHGQLSRFLANKKRFSNKKMALTQSLSVAVTSEQQPAGEATHRFPPEWTPFLPSAGPPLAQLALELSSVGDGLGGDKAAASSPLKAYMEAMGPGSTTNDRNPTSALETASSAHVQELVDSVDSAIHRLILPHQEGVLAALGGVEGVQARLAALMARRATLTEDFDRLVLQLAFTCIARADLPVSLMHRAR